VRSAGFIVLGGRRPVYGFMAASVVLFSADRGGKGDASPCYGPVAGGRCTVAGSRCNGKVPGSLGFYALIAGAAVPGALVLGAVFVLWPPDPRSKSGFRLKM
jgi:hypothetical protein